MSLAWAVARRHRTTYEWRLVWFTTKRAAKKYMRDADTVDFVGCFLLHQEDERECP